ncbi:MAG: glycosyltransferase family 2 protein [Rhodospirillales bacterium]|nr:glycosyltransferase family 2 protein [Rhodospirillales bacterium]
MQHVQHVAGAAGPPLHKYEVDIIILALDRTDDTIASLRSALDQQDIARHIFVVDQGSQADNLARIAAAADGRADVTVVRLDRNYGVAGGRNRGSALGHGRMIVALDNDAEFADTKTLARAVAVLDAAPDVAALAFRIVVFADGRDDLSSWGYPTSLLSRAGGAFDTVTFVGAGHAIRRSAWEDAGGYDDSLFFCWEEYDFCLRAIARGWRVRYRGDIVVRHKVSPERRFAWSGTRWYYFVRNRIYIGRKFGESWLALSPRIGGYLVKGARNGVLRQTLRALPAARRMARTAATQTLPPAARDYLAVNDTAHRGSLLARLRREVIAALPGHA